MVTDIAFTLGPVALLGRRVPLALRVFVSALAVADEDDRWSLPLDLDTQGILRAPVRRCPREGASG